MSPEQQPQQPQGQLPRHIEHMNGETPLSRLLLPPEVAAQLPEIGETQEQGLAAHARVKYYEPDTLRVWYVAESDGQGLFYGLVVGMDVKLTMFTLADLGRLRDDIYLPVERDVNFTPTSLEELKAQHEAELAELEQLALEQAWRQRELEDVEGWAGWREAAWLDADYEDRTGRIER